MRVIAGIFRLFFLLVLLAGVAGGVAAWYVFSEFETAGPPAREGATTIFVVQKGSGLAQTAQGLERDWLVKDALVFRIGVMWNGKNSALKAGEYEVLRARRRRRSWTSSSRANRSCTS